MASRALRPTSENGRPSVSVTSSARITRRTLRRSIVAAAAGSRAARRAWNASGQARRPPAPARREARVAAPPAAARFGPPAPGCSASYRRPPRRSALGREVGQDGVGVVAVAGHRVRLGRVHMSIKWWRARRCSSASAWPCRWSGSDRPGASRPTRSRRRTARPAEGQGSLTDAGRPGQHHDSGGIDVSYGWYTRSRADDDR